MLLIKNIGKVTALNHCYLLVHSSNSIPICMLLIKNIGKVTALNHCFHHSQQRLGSFYVNCPSQSTHHLRFSSNLISR